MFISPSPAGSGGSAHGRAPTGWAPGRCCVRLRPRPCEADNRALTRCCPTPFSVPFLPYHCLLQLMYMQTPFNFWTSMYFLKYFSRLMRLRTKPGKAPSLPKSMCQREKIGNGEVNTETTPISKQALPPQHSHGKWGPNSQLSYTESLSKMAVSWDRQVSGQLRLQGAHLERSLTISPCGP